MSDESGCDNVIAQIFGRDAIVRFAQRGKRTSGTVGVPDRLYFTSYGLLWWEVKAGRPRHQDVLSEAQVAFLRRVIAHDGLAGVGDATALKAILTCRDNKARRKLGEEQVAVWTRP